MLEVVAQTAEAAALFGQEDFDLALDVVGAFLERLAQPPVDVVHLFDDGGAVLLQLLAVLVDDPDGVVETRQGAPHLVVDPRDLASQDVHVALLAVGAHFLVAVAARRAVQFLRAHAATLRHLFPKVFPLFSELFGFG